MAYRRRRKKALIIPFPSKHDIYIVPEPGNLVPILLRLDGSEVLAKPLNSRGVSPPFLDAPALKKSSDEPRDREFPTLPQVEEDVPREPIEVEPRTSIFNDI